VNNQSELDYDLIRLNSLMNKPSVKQFLKVVTNPQKKYQSDNLIHSIALQTAYQQGLIDIMNYLETHTIKWKETP